LFRRVRSDETFLPGNETISRSGADVRKQRLVINPGNKTAAAPALEPGDTQMRTLSFILAFGFVVAGPSMAGSSDNLPGIGTFAISGSPIAISASPAIIVAAR
jgi:hypothetical protein